MGSRARVAAAACVVASGFLLGGVGGAIAVADPGQTTTADTSDRKNDDASTDRRPASGASEGDASQDDRAVAERDGTADPRGVQDPVTGPEDAEPAVREDDPAVDPKADDDAEV
ncbi:MAG: hypothetical protein U1D00_28735, partial [Mycobacterium sp.]|nr:hypothetical protein [Mycobacterium sp.]